MEGQGTYILDWWADHYDDVRQACQRASSELQLPYDEDIEHDTVLRVSERDRPLRDTSDQGVLNYIYRAYRVNLLRERQYARNSRRAPVTDAMRVIDDDDTERIQSELAMDRLLKLVMDAVEQSEDITDEEFNLWRIKLISGLTYRQMSQKFDLDPRYLRKINKKVNAFINNNFAL